MMQIVLNGEPRSLPEGINLRELIEKELRLSPQRVAVERNRAIVPKALYAETVLADGDRLELVHFVGGG